jgi:hypothetical protein
VIVCLISVLTSFEEAIFFSTGCPNISKVEIKDIEGKENFLIKLGVRTKRKIHSMLLMCKWKCFHSSLKEGSRHLSGS